MAKSDKKSDEKKTDKKQKDKSGDARSLEQQRLADWKFLDGHRTARELIVSGHYRDGITATHTVGHDEHSDAANYIGYAERKLGEYGQSKYWYEKVLAADPQHIAHVVLTDQGRDQRSCQPGYGVRLGNLKRFVCILGRCARRGEACRRCNPSKRASWPYRSIPHRVDSPAEFGLSRHQLDGTGPHAIS